MQHAGQLDVDAIGGTTIEFCGGVDTLRRFADERELGRRFESDFFGYGQFGSGFGQRAIAQAFFAVQHRAAVDTQLTRGDSPVRGRSLQQHGARLRPRLAQFLEAVADAGAAAGDLCAEQIVDVFGCDWRRLDTNGLECHAEFFGEQLGEGGVDALTHLGFVDEYGDAVTAVDPQPRDRLSACAAERGRFAATA